MAYTQSAFINRIDNLLKPIYGKGVENLVTGDNYLYSNTKFNAQKLGANKQVLIVLQNPQRATLKSEDSTDNTIIKGSTIKTGLAIVNANVYALSVDLTTQELIASLGTPKKGGEKAYASADNLLFNSIMKSASNSVELNLRHGGGEQGVGQFTSAEDVASDATVAVDIPTRKKFLVTKAFWAQNVWSMSIGGVFDFHKDNKEANKTPITSGKLYGVDADARKVTFDFSSAAEATKAKAAVSGDKTCIMKVEGGRAHESIGLAGIVDYRTTALYGIVRDRYPAWQTSSVAANGELKYEHIYKSAAEISKKHEGAMKDLVILVNPDTYAALLTQDASKERYPLSKEKKRQVGATGIMVDTPFGMCTIISYKLEFESTALVLDLAELERVGSSDITLKPPGRESFLTNLDRDLSLEARAFSQQCIFTAHPGSMCKITGIVNAA